MTRKLPTMVHVVGLHIRVLKRVLQDLVGSRDDTNLIQFLFRITVKLIEILNIDYIFQKKTIKLLNVFSRLFTKSHLSTILIKNWIKIKTGSNWYHGSLLKCMNEKLYFWSRCFTKNTGLSCRYFGIRYAV